MGQATNVELINATPYDWVVQEQDHWGMTVWQFGTVPAGTAQEFYVEFFPDPATNSQGNVHYGVGPDQPGQPRFWLRALGNRGGPYDPHIQVQFENLQTPGNPQGSTLDLGFHNGPYPDPLVNESGPCTFILSGQIGNLRSSNPPGASWMQDNLSMWGGRTLRRLCMPGSHDSGMSTAGPCTSLAGAAQTQTQTQPILGQLTSGSRYFDIRPFSAGIFTTGHYTSSFVGMLGCNGQPIQSIINDINKFTSSHAELIVLDLSSGQQLKVEGDVTFGIPFTESDWNSLLQELRGINGLYVNLDPNVDLSTLTLSSFIGGGKAAVVVILQDDSVQLGPFAGHGFYSRSKHLPIYFNYAGSDQLSMMVPDQIIKMQTQRTSPDSQMFGFDWTLTQNTQDAVLGPAVLRLADWANPWISSASIWNGPAPRLPGLWQAITNECFPNILVTDNVNSLTTALAIAINDFTTPDTAPGKKVNTFQDASGKVTVSVFSRQSNSQREHYMDFGLTVDQDMVCVGGGAIGDDSPGGLLTASYPNEDLSGWLVSSKDHIEVDEYCLTAFAIGLKIDGMTRQQLMDSISVNFADSSPAEHPEAAVSVPTGFKLISGGFKVNYHGAGNMGTASFPDNDNATWRARSKDHIIADPAIIRVYAIGLSQQLPPGSVTVQIERQDSVNAEHPASTAILPPGFAITGGGAEVHYSGPGSLLWKLEPTTQTDRQNFTAASKDHIESDNEATITAYVLGIRIDP